MDAGVRTDERMSPNELTDGSNRMDAKVPTGGFLDPNGWNLGVRTNDLRFREDYFEFQICLEV